MNRANSNLIVSNMIWRFLERAGARAVSFVVAIILSRLLGPSVYGTIALVTVFIVIMQTFIDCGFGTALIQKKDADDLDFSTVFYFNMAICVVLYVVMFFSAPAIARFYDNLELIPIIRVISLTLVISGVKNIQEAYVSRHLLFKKFFYATLGGTTGAAVIGLWMAYRGYGVWALIAQNLFNQTVDTIILWMIVKWRPKKMFSFIRLKDMYSYAWKLLFSNLINTIYGKIRQLIIGKYYSSGDLAFYNKGDFFPHQLIANINSALDSVLLPVMSRVQDDKDQIKSMTRRAIKTSTFVLAPVLLGLAATATPLIRLLLTDKWLGCVVYLRVFCIVYLILPLHTANLNAIKAMGRSDLFLTLEIIKKIMGLTAMLSTIFISIEVMTYSYLATTFISFIINSYPNKKLLNYTAYEQIIDISANLLLAAVMFSFCYSIQYLGMNDMPTILLQILTGAVVYIVLAVLFRNDSLWYVWGICRKIFARKMIKEA